MQNNNEICIIWKTGVSRDYTVHIGRLSSYASFFLASLSDDQTPLTASSLSVFALCVVLHAHHHFTCPKRNRHVKLRMYQHEGISEAEVPTQRSGHNKGSKITIFFSWLIKILEQWRGFTCKYVFTKTVNWRPRRHWSQYKIKTIFKKINQSFGLFWKQNSKRNDLLCLLDLTSRIGGFLFYVFF